VGIDVQVEFLVVLRQEMSVKAGPLSRSESHWLLLVEAVRLVSDEEMLSSSLHNTVLSAVVFLEVAVWKIPLQWRHEG